jgi:hypothetical protein
MNSLDMVCSTLTYNQKARAQTVQAERSSENRPYDLW